MANLEKLASNYRSEGYSALLAEARVCQDMALCGVPFYCILTRNLIVDCLNYVSPGIIRQGHPQGQLR